MSDQSSTPQLRAQIIGAVLAAVAEVPQSVTCSAVLQRVMVSTGLPEESVSAEVMCSTSLLIRSGLLRCNHHDALAGSITYGADTVVVAGESLLGFIWRDEFFASGDDDTPGDGG